jgi:hypothetical protein
MELAFGMNIANFARAGAAPSQQNVNHQIATAGAASAYNAQQDKMEKSQRAKALKAVSNGVRKQKVLEMSGALKPAGVKKGG